MRKLYLTVGVRATDSLFQGYDILKIEIYEIADKYPEVLNLSIDCKPIAILKYLDDNNSGDVLIGNAIDSFSDYLILKNGLKEKGITVDKVFIKLPTLSSKDDIKKIYMPFPSRYDYSLEELILLEEHYRRKLETLADKIRKEGDVVVLFDGDTMPTAE